MAYWLYNPEKSLAARQVVFNLPYPGGNWYTEKAKNEMLLYKMGLAWKVAGVSQKHKKGKKLDDDENEILEQVAAARVKIREMQDGKKS